MLDIKLFREKPEFLKERLRVKHIDPHVVDQIIELDREKRSLQQEAEGLRVKQKKASEKFTKLAEAEKRKLIPELTFVKEELRERQTKIEKIGSELIALLHSLPNLPADDTPEGEDERDNTVLRVVGEKSSFDFKPKNHVELGKKLDLFDLEHAAKGSGSRFYYLKNELVSLQFALIQFTLQKIIAKGFTPVIPPVLVKEHAMFGTGFFPADRNEIYHVNPEDDDLYLAGTSEVSLCLLHADEILRATDLPKRYVGISTCFRREAGSYGKDVHGIFRVHQFDKVEMFSFCHPDRSKEEHNFLIGIEEEILQDLGLHYQYVVMCGGELRHSPAAKKVDLEVWLPGEGCFREVTSCSNCTDFQARRLNIRFKDGKENRVLHTLNGTAMASTRFLIAIMENFQTKDGKIRVPKVLQPFLIGRNCIPLDSMVK